LIYIASGKTEKVRQVLFSVFVQVECGLSAKTRNDYNKVLLPQQQFFSKRWQRRPLVKEELPIWDDMIVKMEGMAQLCADPGELSYLLG